MIVSADTLKMWVYGETLIIGILMMLTCAGYPGWIKVAISRIKGKKYVITLTKDNALKIRGAEEVEGVYETKNGISITNRTEDSKKPKFWGLGAPKQQYPQQSVPQQGARQ
ncbi:hypothetical protein [Methanosarcina sp. UBA289]|uniref:hypothetical protein n=1 Tax=Methanosarcina sp. UBA289 TaxID=1915574 RepID=UPI0025CCBD4C|nr:hypothetical protein [Methanosarcina sp. UBA289]